MELMAKTFIDELKIDILNDINHRSNPLKKWSKRMHS